MEATNTPVKQRCSKQYRERNQTEQTAKLIRGLTEGSFFGSLVIKFEAGRIINLQKTESIKFNI